MNSARVMLAAVSLLAAPAAPAFEADVHYGLTQWLALQAGYDELAARTIAVGDQRVDSGDMQYVGPVLAYACVARDDPRSASARDHHYPSTGKLPGAPEQRAVQAGGDAARKAALEVLKIPPGQAAYMLFKLGEALHILQDSWSHQGVADIPKPAEAVFACDATRAWAHPAARGGWSSHKADLTGAWPADTLAMAKAVYDILTQYPMLPGTPRQARSWGEIRPLLGGFISASTKSDKARWFADHGIRDASFLEGISLRDGARPFELKWAERKLPALAAPQSRQHFVDADLLDFFNRFFEQWVSTSDFEALASAFGAGRPRASAAPGSRAELTARLKVWRLRDHGRVADIAHAAAPLTAQQRARLDAIARERNAYARYDAPASAFFPLLPREQQSVSPLLPFFISTEAAPDGKDPRAVAVVKFRHLPYDTLGVIAERIDGHWRVASIVSVVDH
jgi:hypothetical protein